jgi:hypothetical protein
MTTWQARAVQKLADFMIAFPTQDMADARKIAEEALRDALPLIEVTPGMREAALTELSDCTVDEPKAAAWDALRAHRAMLRACASEGKDQ